MGLSSRFEGITKIMQNNLKTRIDTGYKLNTHLVYLDNERLNSLFEGERNTRGWGENHIIKLGKSKVFVKRIPVTHLEYNHMFSTKNLYDLPTYYNYGVGSAGLGVFREFLAHTKTTNWVLQGIIENFPLFEFFTDMEQNNKKDTKYSYTKLKRLLQATEILDRRTS